MRQCSDPLLLMLQVSATDPDCGVNAQVNYSIGQGFGQLAAFSVQPQTGDICIASALDHEQRAVFEFPVVAMDRGEYRRWNLVEW